MNASEKFKKLTGCTDDELAEIYLSSAADDVCDFIKRDSVPDRLVSVQVELAVMAYNKRGAEGESARSEGGISQTFDELPPKLRERLKSYPKKVGVLYATSSEQA